MAQATLIMRESILFGILFTIFIFAVAIISIYTSQYNAGIIPVKEIDH